MQIFAFERKCWMTCLQPKRGCGDSATGSFLSKDYYLLK